MFRCHPQIPRPCHPRESGDPGPPPAILDARVRGHDISHPVAGGRDIPNPVTPAKAGVQRADAAARLGCPRGA